MNCYFWKDIYIKTFQRTRNFYSISTQFIYCAGITHTEHHVNMGTLKKGDFNLRGS